MITALNIVASFIRIAFLEGGTRMEGSLESKEAFPRTNGVNRTFSCR